MGEPTAEGQTVQPAEKFLTGVLWNWAGVAVQLLVGVVVSPYIILKLGAERYGMWALSFSIMSYYGFLDIGFRAAVVRYSAHYRTRGEYDKLNELINTTFFYFSLASAMMAAATLFLYKEGYRIFQISPTYSAEFSWLVLFVGISIALGFNMGVFSGAVEGFQRFDVSNRIRIVISGIRGLGLIVLLGAGYGLVAMGLWTLMGSVVFLSIYAIWFRRVFPALRFSPRFVKLTMFKETVAYGIHSFVAGLGSRSLEQTPSLLIGYLRTAADLAYYNFPFRLLQYASYAITNVGVVALPQSTALAAKGQLERVAKLGIYANRYCLALFIPLAIFLHVYGTELFSVWLNPDFAAYSAPLLPVLVVGFGLTQAAQFCSGSILFGLAKQQEYAYAVLGEAIASVAALIVVIPRYGIFGAAVAGAALMVLVRGLFAPWILCRHLRFPFLVYMSSILARPLATALPVWVLLRGLKQWGITGRNWGELVVAGVCTGSAYLGAAYFTCMEAEHRNLVLGWAAKWWRRATARGGF